jgi:hypothetical protein
MTYCETSLFGSWYCQLAENWFRDVKYDVVNDVITASLDIPEYVGKEISQNIFKTTGRYYNPASLCIKGYLEYGSFSWQLFDQKNSEAIFSSKSKIPDGMLAEEFDDVLDFIEYKSADYAELCEA